MSGLKLLLMTAGKAPLTVTFNTPSGANGSGSDFSTCGSVSSSGTPGTTVSGGSGTYTYSWTRTTKNHTGANYGISSSTAANPSWSATVCDDGSQGSEVWRVDVTDSVTGQRGDATLSAVTLSWVNLN